MDASSGKPAVSIVMRAHNDGLYVERTLAALKQQTFTDFELIVCDDRSTDGSQEILRQTPHSADVPPERGHYVPGKVLNRAVSVARGEIVVFNNADAVILDDEWLARLIAPFRNSRVAATFAAQEPRADAWPQVRRDHEAAFGNGEQSKKWRFFFSLASSAIRRELLVEFPFNEKIQYSEDVEWAWRVQKRGYEIEYVPQARVEHSHNYPPPALWKRFFNEGIADQVIYGDRPSLLKTCRQFLMAVLRDELYLLRRRDCRTMLRVPAYRWTQKFAHYCGLRQARKGTPGS